MTRKNIKLGDRMYQQLPEVYRSEDKALEINYALKRFLQVLGEGGLDSLFKDIVMSENFYDFEKCPEWVLPLMAKLLGYNYISEVEVPVQRKIISNLVELYRRKGTKSVLSFISREFTKANTQVFEMQDLTFKTWGKEQGNISLTANEMKNTTHCLFSDKGDFNNRYIMVVISTNSEEETDLKLLKRLLNQFMPEYCQIKIVEED